MSDAQPITGCTPGDIAERVFLCGDPARVERITESWDAKREVCGAREFLIVTGKKEGVELSAASHGIGAPGTAVLVEELIKLGLVPTNWGYVRSGPAFEARKRQALSNVLEPARSTGAGPVCRATGRDDQVHSD